MSKEYDIDNAITHEIIYKIDSFVTPLLMLWGQLNSDCNNESFYLAKPLFSDHNQRSWVSAILLKLVEVLPDALQNIKNLAEEMKDIPKDDIKIIGLYRTDTFCKFTEWLIGIKTKVAIGSSVLMQN
ncbi:hypothetical protein [Candidatus Scalindua japonica]|uniref:hypothetical protein n=1 Tax=Candidatus Scalindua japonica TaxID=1284222 RepID=UPI001054655C|nr:hypothetical protein [Candidatus Scalindua japonica]